MGEIKDSLDVIVTAIECVKTVVKTCWDFLLDPFGTLKVIADPVVLVVLASLILLKFMGFKNSDKYIKLAIVIYILILVF